jgi:hypothetical protein
MAIDPHDSRYDPSTAPGQLCAKVKDWYGATKLKGKPPAPVLVNAGQEFPYNSGDHPKLVAAAFRQWLDSLDKGLVRHAGEWWLYNDGAGAGTFTWDTAADAHAGDERAAQLFTVFWRWIVAACGANASDTATANRTRDFVATLAIHPEMVRQAGDWNLPLQAGHGVVLQANGWLRMLDHSGVSSLRMATRLDMLQAHACPRIAAAYEPGITPALVATARAELIDRLQPTALHWQDPVRERAFVMAMLSWASQFCMPRDRAKPLYKGAVFLGDTDTGKSTVMDLVTAVIGKTLVSGAALKKLNKDFGLAELIGKAAWLMHETPAIAQVIGDDLLKMLLTNERITIERKYKEHFEGTLGLLIGLCANGRLKHNDASDATLSRLMYFPMRTHFVAPVDYDPSIPNTEPANPHLKEIFAGQRNILFEVLHKIAGEVLSSGQHFYPAWLREAARAEHDRTNDMRAFVVDAIIAHAGGGWVANEDIRAAYLGWIYQSNSWAAAAQTKARDEMDAIFGILRRTYNAVRHEGKKDGRKVKGQLGVHLNVEGLDWWRHGRVFMSGQRDKSTDDFVPGSKAVNRVPRGTGTPSGLAQAEPEDDVASNVVPLRKGGPST